MRRIVLAASALAMLAGPAFAQAGDQVSRSNGNGASASQSTARASANTHSTARAAAVGNSTVVNVTAGSDGQSSGGDPAVGGATTSHQYIGYGGSYTVRNTPEVIAPSVVGGNACAVGASGGVSLPGFGLAMGATWADRACERRQQAALLFNMGEQRIALELMCQDDNIRAAMKVGGKPCVGDAAAAAPVAEATATQVAAAPAVAALPVAPAPAATPRPDWCARAAPATEASKAYVDAVCGG